MGQHCQCQYQAVAAVNNPRHWVLWFSQHLQGVAALTLQRQSRDGHITHKYLPIAGRSIIIAVDNLLCGVLRFSLRLSSMIADDGLRGHRALGC